MCEYKNCPKAEDEYKKTGYCIFHCDKENFTEEEIEEFNERFKAEFEKQENENEKLEFIGFKFPDNFSFARKEFIKPVNFFNAKFAEGANFQGVTFNEGARFEDAKFTEGAYFGGAKFTKGVCFGGAKFTEEAYFCDATFTEWADFGGAKFTEGVCFEGATFTEGVTFGGATFTKRANFWGATFTEEANFLEVTFTKGANFWGATFTEETYFQGATFTKMADFGDATFTKGADFSRATFGDKADFGGATFQNSVKFIGEENNKLFISQADFSYSVFETPENVEFVDVNLSKMSFLHCKDIDKIARFERIKWAKKDGRNAIYDEIKLDENKNKNYEYVAEIYRKLRLNYERNLRFSEASDFYIGEMEMRRKNVKLFGRETKNRILNLIFRNISLTAWYRNFSYYGESYFLPLLWIFAVIIGFGYLFSNDFLASAQIFFWINPPAESLNVRNFELGINFIINSGWLVLLERILSVLFIALFVLALRRKFKKGGE